MKLFYYMKDDWKDICCLYYKNESGRYCCVDCNVIGDMGFIYADEDVNPVSNEELKHLTLKRITTLSQTFGYSPVPYLTYEKNVISLP